MFIYWSRNFCIHVLQTNSIGCLTCQFAIIACVWSSFCKHQVADLFWMIFSYIISLYDLAWQTDCLHALLIIATLRNVSYALVDASYIDTYCVCTPYTIVMLRNMLSLLVDWSYTDTYCVCICALLYVTIGFIQIHLGTKLYIALLCFNIILLYIL